MKALLLPEYCRLEVVDIPRPEIGDTDVLVRVAACGICGSDVHGYDGSTGRRIPPIVMGHEAAGLVESVGRRVTRFKPGDRVTFDSTVYCGDCDFCRAGRNNLCDRREVLGVSCGDYRRYGAFAEFVAVPERIMFPLPEAVPLEHAALLEAISVAVHAVRITPLSPIDDVVVVGAGMIGLLVIQALREAGVDRTTPTIDSAVRSIRKGGHVTLVGNLAPRGEIPLQMVVNREITLRGSCASNGEIPDCIDMLARGAIDVRPLISACISLDDAPRWFERLHAREPGLMKVIVQP
jgi:L-iditol 2-dehydrogenase